MASITGQPQPDSSKEPRNYLKMDQESSQSSSSMSVSSKANIARATLSSVLGVSPDPFTDSAIFHDGVAGIIVNSRNEIIPSPNAT